MLIREARRLIQEERSSSSPTARVEEAKKVGSFPTPMFTHHEAQVFREESETQSVEWKDNTRNEAIERGSTCTGVTEVRPTQIV